ncbi:hypothetical protein GCM10007304_26170 [Rhodococcoides trifolii]|uniref:Uncharacterized protein n=1 Tax=Rhodococcoides trifolii TaxID=908250 RepID=A0A917FXB3_9NOCA|nr:hypothetical protein GCM10007304_26170 [Rhodococcus trifolii]
MPIAAVVLSLVAALLFACGAVAQQSAASAVPDGRSLVSGLVSSRRWWAGLVGDAGGYLVQVAALAVGSVLIVQPLLVTMLLFALPLSARFSGLTMRRSTWVFASVLAASLVVFLAVGNPTEGNSDAPWSQWALPLCVVVGVCAAATAGAFAIRDPRWRALLLGSAGGVLFGVAVAFTKYVTDLVGDGLLEAATAWQTWALVASGVIGFYLQQKAFQVGPLAASLPAVTVGEPIGAAVLGIAVLDERLRTGGVGFVVVGAAVAAMIASAILLSRVQAVVGTDDLGPVAHDSA